MPKPTGSGKTGSVNIFKFGDLMMSNSPTCGYCNCQTELQTGQTIYPHRHDLYKLFFWVCPNCGAYIGCHKKGARTKHKGQAVTSDGTIPLGIPANASLRKLRMQAHDLFDPIWRGGVISRRKAYAKMAAHLGIHIDDCHISHFNETEIRQFIDAIPVVFGG
jgi:hypothetical protein